MYFGTHRVPVYQTALHCIRDGSNVHTRFFENFVCHCLVRSLFSYRFIVWLFVDVFEKNDKWYLVTVALVINFSRKC